MTTETKVKCVCGEYLFIVNSSQDTHTWADCPGCERHSNPLDLGTPGNKVLESFKEKYKEEYEQTDQ